MIREPMIRALIASLLCMLGSAACAGSPATDFRPAQLREFARDTLTIQRSDGRDQFQIWVAETTAQQQQGLMWVQQLPPDYAIFGTVDEAGMKTVDAIAKTPVSAGPNGEPSSPDEDVTLESATLVAS